MERQGERYVRTTPRTFSGFALGGVDKRTARFEALSRAVLRHRFIKPLGAASAVIASSAECEPDLSSVLPQARSSAMIIPISTVHLEEGSSVCERSAQKLLEAL